MNIALISPSQNAYSETFILAHKEKLEGNVFYYHNGEIPLISDGVVLTNSRIKRIRHIIKGYFKLNKYSLTEETVIASFKKNKIKLIFAEFGPTGMKMLNICKTLDLPLIVHFHGYDASRKNIIERNKDYKELFEFASYIIAVSRKMEQDLLVLGCPREKLIYNVYGPREEFLLVKPRFIKPQFIAIGRFVNKKAPYYLILSFRKVLKKYPEAKLVIAGDGPLWNLCKNLIRYFGLRDKVLLPGVITRNEYITYLQESLAMVQHSIIAEDGDSEGTPLAILEASAAGLPIIATKHAGIPDIIIDGKTGFLVAEHDVKGMAVKMQKLLENSDLARQLGGNGKRNIAKNYNLDRHISVLNDLVKKSVIK